MSTFGGRIKELPFISVDRFEIHNQYAKAFFLSHCHTDHMVGLTEFKYVLIKNSNILLYASQISVRILKNLHPELTANLKELPIDVPSLINVPSDEENQNYLKVTLIPAGHCPGSVMFLFESEKTVLYTGDFRLNTNDLHKYKPFHVCGSLKKIDIIYLDTTFCSIRYKQFPSRRESLNKICHLIQEWINISDKHIIELELTAYYGSEYLLMEIFKATRKQIHVIPEVYNLYKYIPDMDRVITRNACNIKIHTKVNIKSCCYQNQYSFKRVIRPSAMVWDHYNDKQSFVRKVSDYKFNVCYSCHASYDEIRQFVKYLKPVYIEPCVEQEDVNQKHILSNLLSEMMNEYKPVQLMHELCTTEQFLLKPNYTNNVAEVHERNDDALSSPTRDFQRKRCLSE